MNAYSNIALLKSTSWLGVTGADYDTNLRKLLEDASRVIDKYTRRQFWCWEGTRYEDGVGGMLLPGLDVLSLSSLKCDYDGNGVYEVTLAANTDYLLYPLSGYPKSRIELANNSSQNNFANGIKKGVEMVGVFGYGDGFSATPYYLNDAGATTNEELDASELGVDVSSGAAFSAGDTIRIELEQMYIQSIATNTLTVKRGVNGTTAATHATGKAIYVYEYPQEIVTACLITAMRVWKRKDSAFLDVLGNPDTGQMPSVLKGLDVDVIQRLNNFVRIVRGFA